MAITAAMVKELRLKTGAGMMDCKKALMANDGDMNKSVDWLREKGIAKAAKKASRIAAEGLCEINIQGNKAVIFELNSETDFVSKNDQFHNLLNELGEAIVNSDASTTEEALEVLSNGKAIKDRLIEATSKIGENLNLRRVYVINKEDSQNFGSYKHMGGKIAVLTVIDGANEEVAKDVAMHVAAINPKYIDRSDISEAEIAKEKEMLTKEALNEGKPANIVEKMVAGRLNKYLKDICLVNQPFVKNPDLTVEQYVKDNGGKIAGFMRLQVGEGIEKKEEDFASEVMSQVK